MPLHKRSVVGSADTPGVLYAPYQSVRRFTLTAEPGRPNSTFRLGPRVVNDTTGYEVGHPQFLSPSQGSEAAPQLTSRVPHSPPPPAPVGVPAPDLPRARLAGAPAATPHLRHPPSNRDTCPARPATTEGRVRCDSAAVRLVSTTAAEK